MRLYWNFVPAKTRLSCRAEQWNIAMCFLLLPGLMVSLASLFPPTQMSCHCSLRSAATGVGVKSASLTPRSSWRSWRRSTQPASSSPKTRGDASPPPPTSPSARLPSGSRTDGSRRRNSSVNPRAITCTPLDNASELRAEHSNSSKCHIFTSLHRKSWLKNFF